MINRTFTPEWKLWIWSNIVNGYDREVDGVGFIDVAVDNALLDLGGDAEVII